METSYSGAAEGFEKWHGNKRLPSIRTHICMFAILSCSFFVLYILHPIICELLIRYATNLKHRHPDCEKS